MIRHYKILTYEQRVVVEQRETTQTTHKYFRKKTFFWSLNIKYVNIFF
jgi:hypothetical protein